MISFPGFSAPKAPIVRDAWTADIPAMARIQAASFHRGWGTDELERLLAGQAARAHVVWRGTGDVLGFVLSHLVAPEAEILSIAVAPAARGKGLGRLLLTHHLQRLAGFGVTSSHLEVEAGNVAAVKLYRSLGYGEVGRRKGYYAGSGGSGDALVMRLDF